jgi:hypothetical protein
MPKKKEKSFVEGAKKTVRGILSDRDGMLGKIGAKIAKRRTDTNQLLDRIESVLKLQEERLDQSPSLNKKRKKDNSNQVIEMIKKVIKDCYRSIETLKNQRESEREDLERLSLSVNEFVETTLQQVQEIKLQAVKETAKLNKGKPKEVEKNEKPVYSDIVCVNVFEAYDPKIKNTTPAALFKKKRKQYL